MMKRMARSACIHSCKLSATCCTAAPQVAQPLPQSEKFKLFPPFEEHLHGHSHPPRPHHPSLGRHRHPQGVRQNHGAVSLHADVLGKGVAEAFRSDKTPDMGEMVGQLFGNSTGNQQAGMLNQILASVGPAALSGIAGGILGRMMAPGATQITPTQASQLSPDQVKEIVNTARQQNPGLVDQLGSFYAEHSSLLKTLGSAVLAVAMVKMKDHLTNKG